MSNVMDNRCPSCNAPITFNPTLGKFKCEYCDCEFTAEELKSVEDSQVALTEEGKVPEYVSYNCPDCGAQIIADETTSATFCLYCGNSSILKNKLSGEFKPDKIIPFKKVKEDAIEAFKKLAKGRIFITKDFLSEKNIEKITGLYIPFWLYDFKVNGGIFLNATKIKSWASGDMRYTQTDYYDVYREGTFGYDMVPCDGSKKFNNDIMNSIEPFNYKEMVDFNPAYLSGFLAERFEVSKDEAFPEARDRVLRSTEEQMMADAVGYSSKSLVTKNLNATAVNTRYALLPVWMVNIKYEDKYYLFAMNGQTGEFIGDIPLDKKKATKFFLILMVVLFVVITAVYYIVAMMGAM